VAYFPDLSAYSYARTEHPGVVHVGWLDGVHPFPTGKVDRLLIEKIRLLARNPVELYRGLHLCEICKPPDVIRFLPNKKVIDPDCAWARWAKERSSNGEIRVYGDQIVFAAPVLVVHYIEEHGYLPPAEFLGAVSRTR
jgi:hypothetical protein